ncbi:hypothetical protein ACQ4M3_12995 [Leptolyngbya sp. AN03gr2]|uniref:hypothetical protein n=1 Tax=unclassified Leptolyngbya TaxID=2650499 RepID=UPI003D317B0B
MKYEQDWAAICDRLIEREKEYYARISTILAESDNRRRIAEAGMPILWRQRFMLTDTEQVEQQLEEYGRQARAGSVEYGIETALAVRILANLPDLENFNQSDFQSLLSKNDS